MAICISEMLAEVQQLVLDNGQSGTAANIFFRLLLIRALMNITLFI